MIHPIVSNLRVSSEVIDIEPMTEGNIACLDQPSSLLPLSLQLLSDQQQSSLQPPIMLPPTLDQTSVPQHPSRGQTDTDNPAEYGLIRNRIVP